MLCCFGEIKKIMFRTNTIIQFKTDFEELRYVVITSTWHLSQFNIKFKCCVVLEIQKKSWPLVACVTQLLVQHMGYISVQSWIPVQCLHLSCFRSTWHLFKPAKVNAVMCQELESIYRTQLQLHLHRNYKLLHGSFTQDSSINDIYR
jgi:hypothetical protein